MHLMRVAALGLLTMISVKAWAEPLGTAFTYQGELNHLGEPASGDFDLQFDLFNVLSSGAPIATTVLKDNVPVANGVFTVQLDFGNGPFSGQKLWMEISVREGGSSGSYTQLAPRQELTPTPFAIASLSGSSSSQSAAFLQYGGTCPYGFVMQGVSVTGQPMCIQVTDAALGNFAWSPGGPPTISTVDSDGSVGQYLSIVIGKDGFPVIAYVDTTSGDTNLKVTKCNDIACAGNDETVSTVDSSPYTGWETSITIDEDGYPVIAYYQDFPNNDGSLIVAYCNDWACSGTNETITTVDSTGNVGHFTSIAMGIDGRPIISYQELETQLIKTVKCDDPACSGGGDQITTVVDQASGNWWYFAPIAIGGDGLPVISYFDVNAQDLKVVKCNDPGCIGNDESVATVATNGAIGQFSSIAIGADGFPVVLYQDTEGSGSDVTGTLWIAKCNDHACAGSDEKTSVVELDEAQSSVDVEIGADGFPVLSYFKSDNLIVVKCSDVYCEGSKSSTNIDAVGSLYSWTHFASMTIGIDGFPVIAYLDDANESLKVAKCNNAGCTP